MGVIVWLYAAAGLAVGLLVGAALVLRGRRRLAHAHTTERVRTLRTAADAAAARARVERSLRETQAHFQELLQGRPGFAVFTLDAGGNVATWSRGAEELYGYTEAEARGRNISLFYPPAEAAGSAVEMHLLHARSNGRTDDSGWRVRRDGARFRARVVTAARLGADGRVDGFWCLTERLDDESQKSAVPSHREAATNALLNRVRDVAVALAADGKITFLNLAFEKTTGLSRQEWQGRPFASLIHSGDWAAIADLLNRLNAGGSPPALKARLLGDSGRVAAVELTGTPLNAEGASRGSLLLARPLSDYKAEQDLPRRADERTLQSQKLEALGRLAGGVAHDFNNLLTVILGYAELLKQYGADEHAREVGGEIQKAGERAAALTRQLLAFSRKQVLQPTVLDLNGLVLNLDKMLRRLIGEDVNLTRELHPHALLVKADPGQIEQVLTNLVVNARDAMPKGGRLVVSTGEAPASNHGVLTAAGRGYATLTVKDTGQGMDESVLKRLFEPFFTTKEVGKGTGLGLATVHGIVHQSGGRVEVESEPGHGSTFRVYLPLTDSVPDAAPSDPEPEVEAAAETKETILLVEDEEALRKLASRTLQSQGYHILEASDGAAALVLCQRHLPSIDIVVTDVVMPNLSGVDLVQRLKLVRPKLKVLYMSGYTDSTVVRHGIEETAVNYLQKPFTPEVLRRKVRELLDQSSHVRN
jgi:two-component system, cell cycle sensor histidine kinase and response regulator CckA